jgi:Zn-dependent alcohol dehydrogenase
VPPGVEYDLTIPNVLFFAMSEKKLTGCFMSSFNSLRDIPRYLALWRAGQLDLEALITNRVPLADINDGFKDLVAGAESVRSLTFSADSWRAGPRRQPATGTGPKRASAAR